MSDTTRAADVRVVGGETIGCLGPDRLLLGTDFPYENGDQFLRAVGHINDHQIETRAAQAILDKNASVLLGIR